MTGWARWKKWGAILTVLCLIVGIDLSSRPERDRSTNCSLIDAVSAATRPGLSVVGLVASDYERLAHPVSRDAELSEARVEEMVRHVVALAGGLRQRIEPDAGWVVIKVNIVELKEQGSGVITDWRVVKSLIKIVHEIVPQARITIAEGAGEWVPPGSPQVQGMVLFADGFAIAGYRALLQDPELAGIELDIVDLNFDNPTEVSVPDGGYARDQWKLPLSILECDFLISAPVLKIHDTIGMTNAMKNFIGIAPGIVYGWPKMMGYPPHSGNPGIPHVPGILDETIVDLVATAEPDFAVVDAIMCMERAKTDKFDGVPVRLNAILASADVVAADAVSAQLIGLNPFDLEYLTLAAYKGLGQCDLDRIKVKGSPVEQIARRFEKSPADEGQGGEMGHYGQGCRTWLLKGPFAGAQGKAGEEFIDVNDPQALPGQNGWSPAVYFHDDRIDLDKYYDDPFDCAVYAYAEFDAPQMQEAELWVGSDEGLKVWINGAPAYEHSGRRRHRLPNDRVPVSVREGRNAVLVRADQGRSRFDFSLNICAVETDPRYDGNRVWGLRFVVPAGTASAAGKPAAQEQQELTFDMPGEKIPEGATMLEKAQFMRHFDVLMGSFEGCLRFLGEEIDPTRLMGATGHAFQLCVADSIEADGPNRVDVVAMKDLYRNLGYQIRHISAAADDPHFANRQQEAWKAIGESLDRGIPAIARFGGFFWVIKGYHPKKEQYYVSSFMNQAEPADMSDLGMEAEMGPPGLDVLIIGEKREVDPAAAAEKVVRATVERARRRPDGRYHYGLDAFDHWVAELEAGRFERGFGLGFTAGVAVERRAHAGPYLRQVAVYFPGEVAGRLLEAGRCYDAGLKSLDQVAGMFPLMGPGEGADPEDPEVREKVVALLREAQTWEGKAVAQLEGALAEMR